ncbi:septal ring lytic transglycosylase RlpA family protein [Sphingomonas sp. NBWT7]|uniref:septal ring lytic transglycosylase RlpA family protein n=1 Tax=Sphingomonas sp. NBWT7 TaxID=2596913 RepID=UPI001627BA7C|nr:septal ring lytic transglycosylase RlpA family protein [Sphingomonas sp. NBWT7]QNE31223.1 septal ring lytic transglycosylase RlpA family protein [Sphingomonas sp. NBWT7]
MPSSAERGGSAAALLLLTACGGAPSVPLAPAAAVDSAAVPVQPIAVPAAPIRYDAVGYASWYGEEVAGNDTASGSRFDPGAITAAHRTLPLGSFVEVTSLDSGRTILVLVNDRGPGRIDREIDLSRGAAQALGTSDRAMAPVRVRASAANAADAASLAAGRSANLRLDAPAALLGALRARLPSYTPPIERPDMRRSLGVVPAAIGADTRVVQVAAFSNAARARALADRLRGLVTGEGGVYRVRLGPFVDPVSAERARDAAARRGYGDATIIVEP